MFCGYFRVYHDFSEDETLIAWMVFMHENEVFCIMHAEYAEHAENKNNMQKMQKTSKTPKMTY